MPTRRLHQFLLFVGGLAPLPAGAETLPGLDWGTYMRSPGGHLLAVASDGHLYLGSATDLGEGIATPGAFQTEVAGFDDAVISKYDATGHRVWGTYFGGPHYEQVVGIAVDGAGNVYVSGNTYSETGIATPGAHQTQFGGQRDWFIAKFDPAGQRLWATYLGGHGDESDGQIAPADDGVYFCDETSTAGMATPGAHQTAIAGDRDVLLVHFDGLGQRKWATYYGGAEFENCEAIAARDGRVYIAGNTPSPTGIATPGAHKTALGPDDEGDAYVAVFDAAGARQWATYFGGDATDGAVDIAVNGAGVVHIVGITNSEDIATPGAHQPEPAEAYAMFLARLDAPGALTWATYYGIEANGSNVAADDEGRVYIAGTANSETKYASENGLKTQRLGIYDAFVAEFDGAGVRQWGTYYGGDGLDGATDLAAAPGGVVYLAGGAESTEQIATPGTELPTSPNGGGMLIRFSHTPNIGKPCTKQEDCSNGFCTDGVCCIQMCEDDGNSCQGCSKAAGGLDDGFCAADPMCGATSDGSTGSGSGDTSDASSGTGDEGSTAGFSGQPTSGATATATDVSGTGGDAGGANEGDGEGDGCACRADPSGLLGSWLGCLLLLGTRRHRRSGGRERAGALAPRI